MVSIETAHRLIQAAVQPLSTEEIASLTADRRVLAVDTFAPESIPDVPKSAMDGYALRSADGSAPRRVLAEITAGDDQVVEVRAGTAVRIMTGAPLPPGADAMIQVELTEERDGILSIAHAVNSGNNVHTVGQDIALGALVLPAGTILGPAEIGLLATLGLTRVAVYRRPRVAILATGDEVVEPDAAVRAGMVRDSNRYALLAAVRAAGGEPISLGIARDDEAVQRAALVRGLSKADVLITSGGVSMGSRDLIKPLIAELGHVHFGRVAFKPGKPTLFATAQDRLVFGLPGYPVSSLVSFEVFVRPVLRMLQGDPQPYRPVVRVALTNSIRPSLDRPEYQRATVRFDQDRLVATTTGGQGSSRLLSLRGANALLLVPPGEQVYAAGSVLEALLIGPLAYS